MSKHTCLYYDSDKSLLELIVPYFEQGFRNNEMCIWIVPQSLGVEAARSYLFKEIKDMHKYTSKGQMEFFTAEDFYTHEGKFDVDRVINVWSGKERQALKLGFSGVCASGDASWVPGGDWESLTKYEKVVNDKIAQSHITALCTYPSEKYDMSKLFALSFFHGTTIREKDGKLDVLMSRDSSHFK
ncbi:MAG: MEDS domain-containing protein [Candidatus Omnitrophota bacterium]